MPGLACHYNDHNSHFTHTHTHSSPSSSRKAKIFPSRERSTDLCFPLFSRDLGLDQKVREETGFPISTPNHPTSGETQRPPNSNQGHFSVCADRSRQIPLPQSPSCVPHSFSSFGVTTAMYRFVCSQVTLWGDISWQHSIRRGPYPTHHDGGRLFDKGSFRRRVCLQKKTRNITGRRPSASGQIGRADSGCPRNWRIENREDPGEDEDVIRV
jgi:hypothetical protein